MIHLERDIQSLSTFKRNTNDLIGQMKETGNPIILTVNGKAELVVQDAAAYQRLLDSLERLEKIVSAKNELTHNLMQPNISPVSSKIIDLYGSCADLDIEVDDSGIDDQLDDDMIGVFDE